MQTEKIEAQTEAPVAILGDLFEVYLPNAHDDTRYNVIARSVDEAANFYVAAVLSEDISVDRWDMAGDGRLTLTRVPLAGRSGVLAWEDSTDMVVKLDDIPAWRDRVQDLVP